MAPIGSLRLRGPAGEPVDFRRLLASHGVAALAPNRIDEERWRFETTIELGGRPHTLRVTQSEPQIAQVEALTDLRSVRGRERALEILRHLFRLEEDLSGFYERAEKDRGLAWVTAGAGRMLRSATVFEDVVKTICTTNCSWSATIRMTDAIVSELGATAADGRHSFPHPAAMAEAPAAFYADTARAGYRGAYLRKLATDVAEGRVDLEALSDPALPDEEVEQRLLALPGVGPYAAAHIMLTSVGRYARLVLDSWTRPKYARLTGRHADDQTIRRRFHRYGQYGGLAFWLMLTRDWVED